MTQDSAIEARSSTSPAILPDLELLLFHLPHRLAHPVVDSFLRRRLPMLLPSRIHRSATPAFGVGSGLRNRLGRSDPDIEDSVAVARLDVAAIP